MAEKKPMDEEAHWRIDEIERRLTEVPSTEVISGIAAGASAVTMHQLEARLKAIEAKQDEDMALDRQVIESNQKLAQALTAMCEQMCKPTTREITAQLPSGPVTMRVQETRN